MPKQVTKSYLLPAILGVAAVLLPTLALATPTYTIQALGDPGVMTSAIGLNNQGQVVGTVYLPDGNYHAALWNFAGPTIDLGTLPGDPTSEARAINNQGQIIGSSYGSSPDVPVYHSFIWQLGSPMTDLGGSTGVLSVPLGINDQAQVVGETFYNPSSPNFGYLYSPATGITPVVTSGTTASSVSTINNNGAMVLNNQSTNNAIFSSPGAAPIEITGNGITSSVGLKVNDSDTVVGYATVLGSEETHGIIWSESTGLIDLTPGINAWGDVTGINQLGQAVGIAGTDTDTGYPFLYENGTLFNLANMMDSTGWSNIAPEDINDFGQIAGYGLFDGELKGFLLTPISSTPTPEPTTLALLAAASLPLLTRRQKR